jgi:streptogramin lyase
MLTRRPGKLLLGICAVSWLLAACGGGGAGTATTPVVTTIGTPQATAPAGGSTASVSFTIDAPAASTAAAAARGAKFISPATASVKIARTGSDTTPSIVNISPTSPGCAVVAGVTQCTAIVNAPAGSNTFVVTTYDSPNAAGNVLSTATATVTVVANAANTIALTLNGVVASSSVSVSSTANAGTPATITLSVVAMDAAGKIIVGPGNYSTPIVLANSDASGVTALSTTSVAGPSSTVTLAYNGNSLNVATITPSVNGTPGTAANFSPAGTVFTPFALPGSLTNNITVLAPGPDGNVWFGTFEAIGKITSSGVTTVYTTGVPTGSSVVGLVAGPDGAMWFVNQGGTVGSISTGGTVTLATTYNPPSGGCPGLAAAARRPQVLLDPGGGACNGIRWIVAGPDGNLWFSGAAGTIGKVTTAGVVTEYSITAIPGWTGGGSSAPTRIAFASDGNLYVADNAAYLERISISGGAPVSIANYTPAPGCGSTALVVGPDGRIWFNDSCGDMGVVPTTNFSNAGTLKWPVGPVFMQGQVPTSFASSPGGIWVSDSQSFVYRVTGLSAATAGNTPLFAPVNPFSPAGTPQPLPLCVGPDGNVWVISQATSPNSIAKIVYGGPATLSQARSARSR